MGIEGSKSVSSQWLGRPLLRLFSHSRKLGMGGEVLQRCCSFPQSPGLRITAAAKGLSE